MLTQQYECPMSIEYYYTCYMQCSTYISEWYLMQRCMWPHKLSQHKVWMFCTCHSGEYTCTSVRYSLLLLFLIETFSFQLHKCNILSTPLLFVSQLIPPLPSLSLSIEIPPPLPMFLISLSIPFCLSLPSRYRIVYPKASIIQLGRLW
jgi:hypothetical protein